MEKERDFDKVKKEMEALSGMKGEEVMDKARIELKEKMVSMELKEKNMIYVDVVLGAYTKMRGSDGNEWIDKEMNSVEDSIKDLNDEDNEGNEPIIRTILNGIGLDGSKLIDKGNFNEFGGDEGNLYNSLNVASLGLIEA